MSELRRRRVLHMAVLYAAAAWFFMQLAGWFQDFNLLPDWAGKALLTLLVIGFPVALVVAWLYELTPEGFSRDSGATPGASLPDVTGRRLDFIVISLLSAALILLAVRTIPSPMPAHSICIMSFEYMSGDPQEQFIAGGLAEEIRHQLAQLGSLQVIDRESCSALDGQTIEVIRDTLKVGCVLEGTVRRIRDRLRITVQFINAIDGTLVWSKVYDTDLVPGNQFEIQTDIATPIVSKLQAQPCAQQQEPVAQRPTDNPEAYRLYLMGKQRLGKGTVLASGEAAAYFERAIDLDPGFADAYVGLAFMRSDDAEQCRDLSIKALELNNQLGEARATLATSYAAEDKHRALVEFERSMDLSPESAIVHELFGDFLSRDHEHAAQALDIYRSGLDRNPMSARLYHKIAWALDFLQRSQESEDYYKKAIEVEPNFANSYRGLGTLQWRRTGRLDEAMRWLRQAHMIDPLSDTTIVIIGWVYQDLGDDNSAQQWFARARAVRPDYPGEESAEPGEFLASDEFEVITEALHYLDQGNWDAALTALRSAIDTGWRYHARSNLAGHRFDPVRNDPRFLQMVAEVEADMARQLEHVREMERSGELAPMQPVPEAP